jgi:hypothetical protein
LSHCDESRNRQADSHDYIDPVFLEPSANCVLMKRSSHVSDCQCRAGIKHGDHNTFTRATSQEAIQQYLFFLGERLLPVGCFRRPQMSGAILGMNRGEAFGHEAQYASPESSVVKPFFPYIANHGWRKLPRWLVSRDQNTDFRITPKQQPSEAVVAANCEHRANREREVGGHGKP